MSRAPMITAEDLEGRTQAEASAFLGVSISSVSRAERRLGVKCRRIHGAPETRDMTEAERHYGGNAAGRRAVLNFMDHRPRLVSEISDATGMSPGSVTQNLRELKRRKLVYSYRLNPKLLAWQKVNA